MGSERETDKLVRKRLEAVGINYDEQISRIPEINDALKGASKNISKEGGENKGYPEFMAQVNDFFIVIEDKIDTSKQALYCEDEPNKLDLSNENAIKYYAENGALHYALHIVKKSSFKKVFAFGCSGTEKHHKIRPIFVNENGDYKLLKNVENFENFNSENIDKYYREVVCGERSEEDIKLDYLIDKSRILHKDLRKYGNLSEKEKPLVVSAILLALDYGLDLNSLKGEEIDDNGNKIYADGEKIYNAMSYKIPLDNENHKRDIVLANYNFIKTTPKLIHFHKDLVNKTPLKKFAEDIAKDIFPLIKNVNADLLGYFYGEFIRYTGGDGQNLGIVLTPRHITELFCDLLDVKPSDKILDPCCGTGSFLIEGMNRMIRQTNDETVISNIKQNNLHGIESNRDMFSICTANMILRGDGKSNLKYASFFDIDIEDLRNEKFTVGLMNPPYSLGGSETELHFVKRLLDSLADGARCAVIVQQSVMAGSNSSSDIILKEQIYNQHTLEGVISLRKETFKNIGVVPCIAVFKAHQPHPEKYKCKFINFKDDGLEDSDKGLVKTERSKERKKHLLECWHYDEPTESKFMVKTQIKPDDEWLHSFFYFNDEIPTEKELEDVMADYLTFEFDTISHGRDYLFEED